MSFAPKLASLPEAQRTLWPELKSLASRFVLYGGTALALRLGHRQSEDFDYFGDGDLAALPEAVKQSLRAAAAIQEVTHFEPLPGGIVPAEKS